MDLPDVDDAAALDDMLFADAELTQARGWCHRATSEAARRVADHVLAAGLSGTAADGDATAGGRIRIVDYGTGSGLAAKYVARELLGAGASSEWIRNRVELVVVDLPGPWFVAPQRLERTWDDVTWRSLTDAEGRILCLDQVVEPRSVHVVLASMVFHLIPPRALPVAIEGIRRAVGPGGLCVWTSPDSEPRLPGSVLFHDVNRMIRSRFEALKAGRPVDLGLLAVDEQHEVADLVAAAAEPSEASRLAAHRQIPSTATGITDVISCATPSFPATFRQFTSEITHDDLVRVTAVPSNLKNLGEIDGYCHRRRAAELLLRSLLPVDPGARTKASSSVPLTWSTGEFLAL